MSSENQQVRQERHMYEHRRILQMRLQYWLLWKRIQLHRYTRVLSMAQKRFKVLRFPESRRGNKEGQQYALLTDFRAKYQIN